MALCAGALVAPRTLLGQAAGSTTEMDYMDGYHGGVVGHMPPGSWRDILHALDAFPEWKLSLDIEPDSWVVLRREDPEAFARLRELLATGERVEMVGGTYAQPYGWAVSGESNIRQLQIGLRVIREAFPGLPVTTYAVQEPCWASCLPQILRQLGMGAASLKDASTAWGGYTAGYDAELVQWTGPDGSAVTAVPRYAMERLEEVWETESIDATPEFAERCRAAGIAHPAGMCFQDLGWAAKPRVMRPGVRFRTWREYVNALPAPKAVWRFTPEDILVTLPWGDSTLRTVAQQVRSAENRMVVAEKLAAFAAVRLRLAYPTERLEAAWKLVLLSQAHDAWITATTRSGRQAWAFVVAEHTLDAQTAADEVIAASMDAMALEEKTRVSHPLGAQDAVVFNSLASSRREVVGIPLATDPRTTDVTVRDAAGKVLLSQVVVDRRYLPQAALEGLSVRHEIAPAGAPPENDGINHATVLALVDTPAMGHCGVTLEPVYGAAKQVAAGAGASARMDGADVVVETDVYRLRLDAAHGGTVSSLVTVADGTEWIRAGEMRRFGEYRGYFITEKAWRSSADHAATMTLREAGPVRVVVEIAGEVGPAKLLTTLTVTVGEPRLDYAVQLTFAEPTWIGDPVDVPAGQRRLQPRRSQNDGRWKLQVHHPFGSGGELYKSAAFDVCKSRYTDTSFESWDAIKHTILAQWVDLYQPGQERGLALFADGTTGYTYGPEQPLGLVLAWAWEGGFWWGKHPVEGRQTIEYAVLPHAGRWDRAHLWHAYARFCEPLLAAVASGAVPPAHTLVNTGDPGLQLSACEVVDGALLLRFFNASSAETAHTVRLGVVAHGLTLVDLNGRALRELHFVPEGAGAGHFALELPQFGLATVRCRWSS